MAAIFGPQSNEAASHVQSICDAFEMPHIETKWDYKIRKENYLINLYPHPGTLSRVSIRSLPGIKAGFPS